MIDRETAIRLVKERLPRIYTDVEVTHAWHVDSLLSSRDDSGWQITIRANDPILGRMQRPVEVPDKSGEVVLVQQY